MSQKCSHCKNFHDELTKKCPECKECGRVYREANKVEIAVKKANFYAANKVNIRATATGHSNTHRGKMKTIRNNAKQSKKIITMTDDEIMDMTDMPCIYCGTKTIDAVKRNGIDRLDSSKGYIIENCVSCCQTCNFMKGQVDPLTFVERCAHISYLNGSCGQLTDCWSRINKWTYLKYKNRTMRRGVTFELTKGEFEDLKSQNCRYCHRPSTNDHSNGIDRMEPTKGYVLSNCVSCCYDCNLMKRSCSIDDFIGRCIKIAEKEHIFPDVPRVLTTSRKM